MKSFKPRVLKKTYYGPFILHIFKKGNKKIQILNNFLFILEAKHDNS